MLDTLCCTKDGELKEKDMKKVCVRWFDGYYEEFNAEAVRAGNSYLWMKLQDGKNRWLPIKEIRWFSID